VANTKKTNPWPQRAGRLADWRALHGACAHVRARARRAVKPPGKSAVSNKRCSTVCGAECRAAGHLADWRARIAGKQPWGNASSGKRGLSGSKDAGRTCDDDVL
jgi:hypothetical protein